MTKLSVEILERALKRERAARKQAERILEQKARELYTLTQELQFSNKELEHMVWEKTSELKGVFENIIDAFVVMDLSGKVLKMNDAAIDLLGYTIANEPINLIDIVHPDEKQGIIDAFKLLYVNGSVANYQVKVITKEGKTRLVDINASIIYDEKDKPVAAQGIVRDITEFKCLENQKEILLKKLEKSNDELQEYAHVVSHDLKSPLRSIYALVDWIKEDNEGQFNEETLHNFSLIDITLEKMEQLISDVLDYSSVTSENVSAAEVDLNIVFKDIYQILYLPDHIKLSCIKNLPSIKGNRSRLQQLFQNLISNAIRYCDKEEGLIDLDYKDQGEFYQFSIQDNGIGIAPEHHEKIFKIFQSLHQNKESTGVGLSIVKKIVESYQGEIWLESALGEGTTFYFTLKKEL